MSIGIAIYGIDTAAPTQVLELAQAYFSEMGYALTIASFHERTIVDGVDDLEMVEVSVDRLREALLSGQASDFRLYSEKPDASPWFSSFGYSTNTFGSFFAIDIQSAEGVEELLASHARFVANTAQKLAFSYAIIYETGKVSDAMWYARGQNFVTLHADEDPVAFSHDTPGLYEGQRQYESTKLRMVYRKNFVNEQHLALHIDGLPLRDWIFADPARGQLDQITASLWCWTVPAECLAALNDACGKAGVLLAWKPRPPATKRKLP